MTEKERLVAKIKQVAKRLGKPSLTKSEFLRAAGLGAPVLYRHFDNWAEACFAAGLRAYRMPPPSDDVLFAALRDAFLAHGGLCSRETVKRHLRMPYGVVERRFPSWGDAMVELLGWLRRNQPDFPYLAELARRVAASVAGRRWAEEAAARAAAAPERVWRPVEGPVLGDPLNFRGMMRTPVNEMGVVALFALVAVDLGFEIDALGRGFPDCRARRRIGPGRWQEVRAEFEHRARNFIGHNHDLTKCDLIICWENDWPDCPIEVIELKEEIKKLKG